MKYLFRKRRLRALAAVMDASAPLWRLFAPSKRASRSHVLVVRLDHIGDILPATAIPQILKERYGARRVSFLTSSAGAELLENNPFVDEIVVYDAPWFARGRSGRGGFWGTLARLRALRPDLALLPRGDARENLLAYAARVPERIGYGVTGGGAFLSKKLDHRSGVHESDHTRAILRQLGIDSELVPAIYFSQDDERRFTERLRQWGLVERDYACVQMEAGTEAKRWTEANIAAFLELCASRFGDRTLAFVGSDAAMGERIEARAARQRLPWKVLAGRTSLRESLWVISRAKAFVGHDSGPTHAAAAMGVPTLFLYSGTNSWEEWRPNQENAEVLRYPVPCSPCHLTRCPVPGHPCMAGIEPERAAEWLRERIYADR